MPMLGSPNGGPLVPNPGMLDFLLHFGRQIATVPIGKVSVPHTNVTLSQSHPGISGLIHGLGELLGLAREPKAREARCTNSQP